MTLTIEQGSFRDRRARVIRADGKIFRCLDETSWQQWSQLKQTPFFQEMAAKGQVVGTREAPAARLRDMPDNDHWRGLLEHDVVPAITYPYEWSFSRLKDAALFHLDLLRRALAGGWVLKNSTPFNIQWRGGQPVFIDIPSFEPLVPGEPWVGYRQFCEMFLFPLMLSAYKGVHFQTWLRGDIDGIKVDQMAGLMSLRDLLFRRGTLTHVYLHSKLQQAMGGSKSVSKASLKSAGFGKEIILANVEGMRKLVNGLSEGGRAGHWADYAQTHSYNDADYRLKQAFVTEVVGERRWGTVWDLGCNTGDFSKLAAAQADVVLALDSDHGAVDRLYHRARSEGMDNVLALLFDLASPSPPLGWRSRERLTLEQRRPPELVLALALIHHVVISANIPLGDFVEWLADMNTAVVVEFVSKDDEMTKALLRNKPDIYSEYSEERLRGYLERRFQIRRTQTLKNGLRTLYYATPN